MYTLKHPNQARDLTAQIRRGQLRRDLALRSIGRLGGGLLACAVAGMVWANPVQVPALEDGAVASSSGVDCGTLLDNSDGTWEQAIAWTGPGVAPPYYGAFAECYNGEGEVCAAQFAFTQLGYYLGQAMDVYVWGDESGVPGQVLCLRTGVLPGEIAVWPEVSTHVVGLNGCCVTGNWWVGFWGVWPDAYEGWYVGHDRFGGNGCPFTNAAPESGFDPGWQRVDGIFGATKSIGIAAQLRECNPVATEASSWGRVKARYGY